MSQNGAAGSSTLLRTGSTKLETLRNWGVSTYKCTKQILYEKLGKSSRTVDTGENYNIEFISILFLHVKVVFFNVQIHYAELEAQIEILRETQRKYNGLLRLSSQLTAQLAAAGASQRALGEAFAELAQKSPELQNQLVLLNLLFHFSHL